jgi:DNA polymerase-3 subunit epsilon
LNFLNARNERLLAAATRLTLVRPVFALYDREVSSVLDQPLAFVDIETTGGSHFTSRVLEVGVVRVEGGRVVATYKTLLQPDGRIPSFITSLTGITNDDVADSPRFNSIADELAEILDGAVFVAHNVRFDYAFLKMEFERLGATFRPPLLCTVRLSRKLFPQYRTHKLQALIERHNLSAPARHRAYDDANCLWQFYRMCLAEFDLDTVEAAVKLQLETQAVPSQLDAAQVAALPEGPGVYVFEDEAGAPLYVGKSVSVRRRVMSHFSADYGRGAELKLAQAVRQLRAVPTHGELGALLLESEMVKDLQPQYNRQLRRKSLMTLVLSRLTEGGYQSVELCDVADIDASYAQRLLAIYTSKGRAKLSLQALGMKYRLCPKLLGLEKTNHACFLTQLGKCDGACDGRETTRSYNERFDYAFERNKIAVWPYRGPILIRESRPEMAGSAGFVVDGWCLIAHLVELEDGSVEVRPKPRTFELDSYKIIRQFIEKPVNRRAISRLSQEHLRELLEAEVLA